MCGCNAKLSLGPAACLKPWHREEVGLQVELVLNLSASFWPGSLCSKDKG